MAKEKTCTNCKQGTLQDHECISCKHYGCLVADTQAKSSWINRQTSPEPCPHYE